MRAGGQVESFTFYLLTEAMGKQEWVLGYFSKVGLVLCLFSGSAAVHASTAATDDAEVRPTGSRKRSRTTTTTSRV